MPSFATTPQTTLPATAPTTNAADAAFAVGQPFQVTLNGLNQTLLINTHNPANPILLVLHGGPGYAMLPLMHAVNPQLEAAFTVVNWDQRGAGLSPETKKAHLTLKQLVADAHALTVWLKAKFGQDKIYILGHSFGTVLGLYLVKEYPNDYAAFVGVGQTVNVAANEQYSYDWVLAQAKAQKDTKALRLLKAIGRPDAEGEYPGEIPDKYADTYEDGADVTSELVARYGGDIYGATNTDKVEELILGAGLYDEEAWADAWEFSQHLFEDEAVWAFDFRDPAQGFQHLAVPVYFFMGQHDYDTPVNLFEDYYAAITSPKTYIRFEQSAHFPFYEEPEKFRTELLKVKAEAGK